MRNADQMAEEITETFVSNHIEQTAEIVAAYVEHNAIRQDDLPKLIADVHASLRALDETQSAPVQQDLIPAVPIKRSITPDHIVCLEDGKTFKSLKRHLRTEHELPPEQYREKWKLPGDYPMVASKYSEARSSLAKSHGLGQKR